MGKLSRFEGIITSVNANLWLLHKNFSELTCTSGGFLLDNKKGNCVNNYSQLPMTSIENSSYVTVYLILYLLSI